MNNTRVISVTKKNIKRNKWLTVSTILVATIVFTLTSVFLCISILLSKTIDYYEQRAQVIVFFKKGTPQEEILQFKEQIDNPKLVEEIDYVSQEEALEVYKQDFADDPDLISTVTAESLPASLEIRAKDIDSLIVVIDNINKAKETNPNVDDVMYFEDVDLCKKVQKNNLPCVITKEISLFHLHGGASRVNPKTKAITKSEVIKSRHVYISNHFSANSQKWLHPLLMTNNLLSVGILSLLSFPLFFFKKLQVNRYKFLELCNYYASALKNKTWLSNRSTNFKF